MQVGQKIKIYVAKTSKAAATDAAKGGKGKTFTYTVKSGDNLNSIADKYPKNTVASIKKANELKSIIIKKEQE